MTRIFSATVLSLLAGGVSPPAFGPSATVPHRVALHAEAGTADTVHVAPPTGEREADRASILAALDEVEPGGTVLFAPGTYLVGELVPVPRPDVTFLAHEDGTTLRGCEPADYPRGQALREALASGEIGPEEYGAIVRGCGLMELTGGGVAVRGFTIDHTRLGICISSCFSDPSAPVGDTVGGYRIEYNTFSHSGNGVRGQVVSSDTTVIRDNRFINTFHAVSFLEASHLHVVDNQISAPEPEETPGIGHVSFAVALGGDRNLVARNRIEGHPDGILLAAGPGSTSSRNVIRGNTIAVARNPLPDGGSPALASSDPADATIVGVPLALHGQPVATAEVGRVAENLVEDNRIHGAEGIGIELYRASENRIVDNEVSGVVQRRPFPGNSVSTDPGPWRQANGSGIWLSPGSDGNEIVGNTFEDVEGAAIFLQGDSNGVELRSADDSVRNLGTENRVGVAAGGSGYNSSTDDPVSEESVLAAGGPAATQDGQDRDGHEDATPPDTVRYVEVVEGRTLGSWRTWEEGPRTRVYEDERFNHFDRTEHLEIDGSGLPIRLEGTGRIAEGVPWYERFERGRDTARWFTPRTRGTATVGDPAFYETVHPAIDIPCHARKFAARMEDPGYEDVFSYETEAGGHGKVGDAEEWAMIMSFFLRHLHPDHAGD